MLELLLDGAGLTRFVARESRGELGCGDAGGRKDVGCVCGFLGCWCEANL